MQMASLSVAEGLWEIAVHSGVSHVFGIPGDYSLTLCDAANKTDGFEMIITCNELNAAYAADGYSRIRGLGVALVAYGVGEVSGLNGLAGSFAEGVPIIYIVGLPTRKAWNANSLAHHALNPVERSVNAAKQFTTHAELIQNPNTAIQQIITSFAVAIARRLPVYIGIHGDVSVLECNYTKEDIKRMWEQRNKYLPSPHSSVITSDKRNLNIALDRFQWLLNKSEHPLVIFGGGIRQFRLQELAIKLVNSFHDKFYGFCTTPTSKGGLPESHTKYKGCFFYSDQRISEEYEKSDMIFGFGLIPTDVLTGGFVIDFIKDGKCFLADESRLKLGPNEYLENVFLPDLLSCLLENTDSKDDDDKLKAEQSTVPNPPDVGITVDAILEHVPPILPERSLMFFEAGSLAFNSMGVKIPNGVKAITQNHYLSIGYTLPATLGACLADRNRRVFTFIGDSSLQLTVQELSSLIRHKCNATILVLNNGGMTIERVILDGKFNDIQPWKHTLLPIVFGGKEGIKVDTMQQLVTAVKTSDQDVCLIEMIAPKMDCGSILRNMALGFRKNIGVE